MKIEVIQWPGNNYRVIVRNQETEDLIIQRDFLNLQRSLTEEEFKKSISFEFEDDKLVDIKLKFLSTEEPNHIETEIKDKFSPLDGLQRVVSHTERASLIATPFSQLDQGSHISADCANQNPSQQNEATSDLE